MEEYLSKKKIHEKKWILEFVPNDLLCLTLQEKISYKNKQLKTAYLIHLVNYMITKYYQSDKKENNLSSEVLRKWYGTHYNFYLDYLLDNNILNKTKNYLVGYKSNAYTLNEKYYSKGAKLFTRWKNKNSFLLKKWKNKQLEFELDSLTNIKCINPWVKKQLIDDLYHVEIDFENASKLLLKLYEGEKIEDKTYYKNLMSIESIRDGTLFYVEDSYGRLHTNFTVLKKIIRKDFVKINGDEVEELDIANSQPTFLAIMLKEYGFDKLYPKAYEFYKNSVKNGIFYDLIADDMKISRKECKQNIFYVLFGENKWNTKIDITFKKIFPEVFEWMIKQKKDNKDHRTIAHELQRKESNLIFDNIIFKIKKEIPDIKLFTVHDSILFPKKYHDKVSEIFYNQVDLLFG